MAGNKSFTSGGAIAAILLLSSGSLLMAQETDTAAVNYTVLPAVHLYDGPAPGSENPRFPETMTEAPVGRVITNVSVPDYTPYIPEPGHNTRTAVIIAPGGAFRLLAMDHEGHGLAKFLAARGLAAFVLKYRVVQTDPAQPAFGSPRGNGDGGANRQPAPQRPPSMEESGRMGVADGARAITLVREHAGEYAIDPDRVVFIGFSAGAHVASYMGLNPEPGSRADYIAPIYGAPFTETPPPIPDDMPPVFMAWAQDDPLVLEPTRAFYDALVGAGRNPEAHIYMDGGHGFGMLTPGKSSDAWRDAFFNWLTVQGLTSMPGAGRP